MLFCRGIATTADNSSFNKLFEKKKWPLHASNDVPTCHDINITAARTQFWYSIFHYMSTSQSFGEQRISNDFGNNSGV